ncbi:MAG: phage portal protein [Selenomonadaceae bacterium]|nr:phage portal protein [Selenomonadaceae bacterium]
MRLTINKSELTLKDIGDAVRAHWQDAAYKLKLKNYYVGKHSILGKRGRDNTNVNNRLVSNYAAYISNISTGFFIGQPIVYKSVNNEQRLETLLDIFKYNDEQAHNLELAEEASITGDAYEFLYLDGDAQIRLATVPSEEIILICDSTLEQNILYAIRHFRVYGLNLVSYDEFVDVYDSKNVTHYNYSGGNLKLISTEPHYFDDVPIIEFPNNRQHRGDFEDVITLIDAYNMAQSLTLDDLQDFTDAFLLIKGMHVGSDEGAKDLRRRKIIELEDSGDARWLIKDLNDTYVENVKTRLQKDIHKFSNIPDMSDDSFAGNVSGVAIKYKLIGLEQIRSRKEREFKKALQRRIELVSGILKLKSLPPIDFREIDIQFTANIPANLQEQATIVQGLDGIISQKTLLSLLPFVTNPAEEIDELKREKQEDLPADDYNFEHNHEVTDDEIQ